MPVPHIMPEYTCLIGGMKKVFKNACSEIDCQRVHLLDRGN